MSCKVCGSQGFYFDSRCMDNVCAHAGLERLDKDDKGNVTKRHAKSRIMACPSRPCTCPSGVKARAELRMRVAAQEHLFNTTEQVSHR